MGVTRGIATPNDEELIHSRFPRASRYPATFHYETVMGPNVLWLTEALTNRMTLEPGMRVLDLGCGRAASSIFLAREFGVTVFAADLWIRPTENLERIHRFDVEDRVFPLLVEAHDMPFADGFFDAVVSVDAYHYFGTDDLYLGHLARLIRPGGQIGIVVPGLVEELNGRVPEHLAPYWDWEFTSFHSANWWRNHWQQTGLVNVERAESIPNAWQDWRDWCLLCAEQGAGQSPMGATREAEMLDVDAGRTFTLECIVARTIS